MDQALCWETTVWFWTPLFHPQFWRRNITHVLTIESMKQLLVVLSTLCIFRVRQTLPICWANCLLMMNSTPSWSPSCFESQRLGGNRKANTSFPFCDNTLICCLRQLFGWGAKLFVCFCADAICSFLWQHLCLFAACVWERGVLGMRHILSSRYLWGSRSVYEIHPNLLHEVRKSLWSMPRVTWYALLFMEWILNWDCEQIEWRAWLNSDLRTSDSDWRMP